MIPFSTMYKQCDVANDNEPFSLVNWLGGRDDYT